MKLKNGLKNIKNMKSKKIIEFLITPLVCVIIYVISKEISDTFISGWIGGGTAFFLMNILERYFDKKYLNHKVEDKQ